MSETRIITISRSFGSRGKEIGEMLAKELGYTFLDKDIMRLASEKTGIVEDYFESDRSPRSSLLYSMAMGLYGNKGVHMIDYNSALSDDRLFGVQSDIIREKANEGNCVFVGRCAGYVLRKYENCINVFITADMDDRVKRIMENEELDEAAAKKKIQKMDKKRRTYYSYFTNREWANALDYHLCLNVSKIGIDGTVQTIKEFVEKSKR